MKTPVLRLDALHRFLLPANGNPCSVKQEINTFLIDQVSLRISFFPFSAYRWCILRCIPLVHTTKKTAIRENKPDGGWVEIMSFSPFIGGEITPRRKVLDGERRE
jgi:hypothetical protein